MLESPIPEIILFLFLLSVLIITVYTLGEFHLGYIISTRSKEKGLNRFCLITKEAITPVTVQLPMYNERYVAEATVIDAASKLDYPTDKLEIQVIDDSDDETIQIVEKRVTFWQDKGIDIKVVRRKDRKGYKAGALADATHSAKGDFLAIFDADFLGQNLIIY